MVDGNKAVAWTGPVNEDELQVEKLGTVQRLVFGDDFETDNGRAGSGFGSNTGGGFGSKPAFGTSTSGGLFGGSSNNTTTNTSTFGGFGANNTSSNTTSSPFGGGSNTSSGIFGANKAGFGAPNNTGSSLFGGGNTNSGGFGTTSTGFGATGGAGDPPGTASTPFNAYTEKEPNSSISNSYQNILFQEPYKKWSSEELRLVDYAQGRRHGNATGGGAFGVSSGFGGFGSNTNTAQPTNLFGTSNAPAGAGLFGSNANATGNSSSGFGGGGFGATNQSNAAGSGLFGGANKPAGGGLFGNTQTQQNSGGGVFGASGSGGFGTPTTNNTFGANNSGGGLFGSNANKQGTGFSFGNNNNTNTTNAGSGFGSTSGSAFGSTANTTGSTLFGNNANTSQSTGAGLFGGGTQQQQNTSSGFGAGFGGQPSQNQQSGGIFGNQQKPAAGGLFGGAATGTTSGAGVFGGNNAQQQNTGAGLFGSTGNTSSGESLFGNKATTGGGLFGGGSTTQSATGGASLFGGNNQPQQAAGGGIFGASNSQKPGGGLFGGSAQGSGGLFGSQPNQASGGSLFGAGANQQQNQGILGNSLLGSTQQNNNIPQGLTANLNDVSAYGSPSLFAGLGGNEVTNPGPLATPLGNNSKPRKSSILPMYKLAPATAASRFGTPQKRGFGFSYSSYGTPGGSPASSISSTPGTMGRSLLGPSSNGSLNRSISTSNLRRSFNAEDSILAPGAFASSSNTRWYGSTGSKKLVINRDIRSDLFSTPQKDKTEGNGSVRKLSKRVSFDTSTAESQDETPVRNALPPPEDTPTSQTEEATPRQSRNTNGVNGSQIPETEHVKGNELAIVHEDDNSATPEAQTQAPLGFGNVPGKYWMRPSREELQNMNRMQRLRVDNFTVGRDHVGYIKFKVPVDMSNIELDDICGGIIQLDPRSATVYPVQAKKPPVGKGLNVPAQISLEQSWPRGDRDKRNTSDPKRVNKHVERLKRIPDTVFESYDKETGVWTFGVEHFTTYGLDDSDEESSDADDGDDEEEVPSPAPDGRARNVHDQDGAFGNAPRGEDTPSSRKNQALPGAFDDQVHPYEAEDVNENSFLGISSADSAPSNVRLSLEDEYASGMGEEYESSDDEDMARSSSGQHLAAGLDDASSENDQDSRRGTPGGILRARMRAVKDSAGPVTVEVVDGDDWMEMLRKTVSPVKRDRQLLREMNETPSKLGRLDNSGDYLEFDLGKTSIWGNNISKDEGKRGHISTQMANDKGLGFATSIDLMNSLFEKPKPTRQNPGATVQAKGFPQDKVTEIKLVDGIPMAALRATSLGDLFHGHETNDAANIYEKRVWELASILFDDMPGVNQGEAEDLARKQRLSQFWTGLVEQASTTNIGLAGSSEEKAVASLAGHRIPEACKFLADGKNFRLGTLVPLIGTSEVAKTEMREQLRAWHDSKVLSEFSEAIRTIYELLSGNVCVCEGMKNVPVEDRMESFVMSKKFGLDWRQSFGLRLWYATSRRDSAALAVLKFKDDIKQDREEHDPQPWYREQGLKPVWEDANEGSRQDLLWGLLQLYADRTTDLEAVLRPENSRLSPLDMRLCWQLGQGLTSTGRVSFGAQGDEKADAATIAYAAQLTAAGDWLEAIFVLLHLRNTGARAKAIQEQLCRHAGLIGPDNGTTYAVLTEKFLIPGAWLWQALALYMRSVKHDASAEVHCLLRAGEFVEAHQVLVRQVAPRAIIERDYATLSCLLSQFQGRVESISQWARGGEIYNHFLSLVAHRGRGESTPPALLEKLLAGLNVMNEMAPETEIMRYAAISDMADDTAREMLKLAQKKRL
ncbi:hypothetical protein UVI_02062170 [Ustilaginoidea virens]|uniref:Peptidase S59 domain-containing protein n=1 Tax=Ustilaginoidea virens TaxID=1159556 RepID=A0A1B5L506_USTVR|nr:hypothetical protein UVI_02062170 [Ustilaginoidea virens]